MPFRLYNTFSKREEDVVPQDPKDVKMYTCGPTVYGRPHIGNYSSFLMADLLRRWMETGHGWTVKHVKNITDVGHLVADADSGEDKVEKQAKIIAKEKRGADAQVTMEDVLGVAEMYTAQFLEDEKALNMMEPFARPKATETIPEMIEIIRVLIEKKHAYETEDGVYFSVESFPDYGRLSGNTLDKLNAGARVHVNERKKHPADFALWKKAVGENAHHVLRWDSPWGPGFPGWHIECSAMARKILGDTLDLHTGGEDNIFPHHECEIAQSESASFGSAQDKKPFVRLWLHKRRIDLAGEKMSKSLGNVLSIPDVKDRGYSPLDLRYYFLSVHYRTNLKFTWKGMDDAKQSRRSITDWIARGGVAETSGKNKGAITADDVKKYSDEFAAAMDSDLNTPGALAAVFECMHKANGSAFPDSAAAEALKEFTQTVRSVFGCFEPEIEGIPDDVQKLVDERASARKNKDFAASDRLRDAIAALGYELKDTAQGQQVRRR